MPPTYPTATQRLVPHSKESRLNVAYELLVNLVPDYDGTGYQSRLTEALRLLREIPR